jgi:hypothetical protein
MPLKELRAKILEAELRASKWLRAAERMESHGYNISAARFRSKVQYWVKRVNKLKGNH